MLRNAVCILVFYNGGGAMLPLMIRGGMNTAALSPYIIAPVYVIGRADGYFRRYRSAWAKWYRPNGLWDEHKYLNRMCDKQICSKEDNAD